MIFRSAMGRVVVCLTVWGSLWGGPVTRTYVLENSTDLVWLIQEAPVPDPRPGIRADTGRPEAWTDRSSSTEGFSGILQAHASVTLTVTAEASAPPPELDLFRAPPFPSTPRRLKLDPAWGPPSGGDVGGDRILITEEGLGHPAPPPAPEPMPAGAAESGAAPGHDRWNPAEIAMTLYCSRDLTAIFARMVAVPGLEALAAPVGEWSGAVASCGKHFASQQALLAQAAALGPGAEPRRLAAIRNLLELREGQVRSAFLKQAGFSVPPIQARLLQRLAATHRRLVDLRPGHAQARADVLAGEYQLLHGARLVMQGLAYDWDAVAMLKPWGAWRKAWNLPEEGIVEELCGDWASQGGGPLPAYLAEDGPGLFRLVDAAERERRLAEENHIDLDCLRGFDLAGWSRGLAEQSAAEQARRALAEEKRMAAERVRAQRAERHRMREIEQQKAARERAQREQESRREAAARAKAQRKQEMERRAEALKLAEAARKQGEEAEAAERAALRAAEAQREQEMERRAEALKAAEAAREHAEQAQRAEEAEAAERAILQAAQVEAACQAEQARGRSERKARSSDILLIPPGQRLSPYFEARVKAALESYWATIPQR
jgi:hypothetical protein